MSTAPVPAVYNRTEQAVMPKSIVPDPRWSKRDQTISAKLSYYYLSSYIVEKKVRPMSYCLKLLSCIQYHQTAAS